MIIVTRRHFILRSEFHQYLLKLSDTHINSMLISTINDDNCTSVDCQIDCRQSVSAVMSTYRTRYFGRIHSIVRLDHDTYDPRVLRTILDMYMCNNSYTEKIKPVIY